MTLVRKDDNHGGAAAVANPPGWLHVTVSQIEGAEIGSFDFDGWQSFRHWVEKSDPGCAIELEPPKPPALP